MANINISMYSFELEDRRTRDRLVLNPEIGNNEFENILNCFNQRFQIGYNNNQTLEKLFKIEDFEEGIYRENQIDLFKYVIYRLKSGKYGVTSEIVSSHTGVVNHQRGEEEADVMPFFVCIAIPINESTRGVIITQNNGIYGVKTIFNSSFKQICTENEYRFSMNSIVPTAYIDKFIEEGVLKKVKFIRHNIPNDRAERIGLNRGMNGNNLYHDEYTIHRPVGFMQRNEHRIREFMNGQRGVNEIVELGDFEYNNIKLEFSLGGKNKTLNLTNLDRVVATEDIGNDITLNGGHPTRESISPILIENSRIYLSSLGII